MKNIKMVLLFLVGMLVGFGISAIMQALRSPQTENLSSGLNVHAITGLSEDRRGFERDDRPLVTAEHILWYDWKSNIFALDAAMLDADIFEDALRWDDDYRRLVVSVDDVVVLGILYAEPGMHIDERGTGIEVRILPDMTFFYGDTISLGGYDGSVARLYSIEEGRLRGTLNTRIYYELARNNRLLEQKNSRYVLTEFSNVVGQTVHGEFSLNYLSIVTFEPTGHRNTMSDPVVAKIINMATGEIAMEFTHFVSMPISLVMDAGRFEIYVSGGGFVSDDYRVSAIAIPSL